MKKILVLFLVIIMTITAAAVYADDYADVVQAGTLRLGVPTDYIPFVFYDDSGELTGIDVALMQEVARRMGVTLKTTSIAYDSMADSLNLGQVDVVGGALAKTDERMEVMDFSRVYYNGGAQFIGLKNLLKPADVTLDSFRNLTIGVQKGTSFDQWIKTNLVGGGYISSRNVYTYSTAVDEMRALDRGDVDLVVLTNDIYEDVYQSSGKYQVFYDGFMKESYAFGMRKGSSLVSVVNQHLTDMIKDGTAQSIADRFFRMNFNDATTDTSRSSVIATPTSVVPVVVIPTAAPQTNCTNYMNFVSDVTITDGHQVSGGEKFRKTWRVRNTGTCTWTTNYTFVYVSGDQMSGRNVSIPQNVAPGQTVDISVDLVGPSTAGTYRGYWQMRSPQGQNFGETIWVKVRSTGGSGSNDGQKRVIPQITQFYPDFYSGGAGTCPTVYWKTSNAATVDITVDGTQVYRSYSANGSQQICGPLLSTGNHTVQAHAYSVTDDAYASFTFKTTGNDDGQKRTIPVIGYFYINPTSGETGDSTTAYWSVSNAGGVDLYVDGTMIERSSNTSGSSWIYSELQGVGTHSITLIAHSVTDDASDTVYFTMNESGQKRVVPSVDYFYASPSSGYSGDGTTVYWSVTNAASVDIYVDGSYVSGGSASGSAWISSELRSIGTHTISLVAHSVTDDVNDYTYYTTEEHATGFGVDDSGSSGGWAGSNYYDDTSNNDQGGWAGSNYYDDTSSNDQGGWADSNYYEEVSYADSSWSSVDTDASDGIDWDALNSIDWDSVDWSSIDWDED